MMSVVVAGVARRVGALALLARKAGGRQTMRLAACSLSTQSLPFFEDDDGDDDELDRDALKRWKNAISAQEDSMMEEELEDEEISEESNILAEKLLLDLGRVSYHHNGGLPDWLLRRKTEMSQYRTTAQLRRCLQTWMLKRHDFDALKKISQRSLYWYDQRPSSDAKLTNAVVYGPEETAAYAHFFLPSRYTISKRVLDEVSTLLPNFKPKTVLDFGCGPATAAAAIETVWPKTMKSYVGVDHSQAMLDAAKIMTAGLCEASFWPRSADVVRRDLRFDMVVLTYTLSDLPHDPARRAATQLAFELLNEDGVLVVVEEGNPMGSHTVRTARQFLLDTFNQVSTGGSFPLHMSKEEMAPKSGHMMLPALDGFGYADLGATVIAPCTHDRPCPLAAGVWCSFSQKVSSPIIRKDSEEKFSYLVMRKQRRSPKAHGSASAAEHDRQDPWVQSPSTPAPTTAPLRAGAIDPLKMTPRALLQWLSQQEARGKLRDVLADVEDVDWDTYEPTLLRPEWARILRSPLKAKGHITVDLCSPTGRIIRHTHSRSMLKELGGVYIAARKVNWGGLFPFYMSDIQHSAFADKQQRAHLAVKQVDLSGRAPTSKAAGSKTAIPNSKAAGANATSPPERKNKQPLPSTPDRPTKKLAPPTPAKQLTPPAPDTVEPKVERVGRRRAPVVRRRTSTRNDFDDADEE